MSGAGLSETISAPGVRPTTVTLAPRGDSHESKRVPIILDTEVGMVDKMKTLRIQTVEKNREFLRQVTALDARRVRSVEKLAAEVDERERAFEKLRAEMTAALDDVDKVFLADLDEKCTKLQVDGCDPADKRLDVVSEKQQHFKDVEVPETNDRQSGDVVRRMLKSRETFDIENTKIAAREAQIVARFQAHVEATAKRFSAEATDRYNMFTRLGESLGARVAADDRDEERVQIETLKAMAAATAELGKERATREDEDGVVLENVSAGFIKLQKQILDNFGATAE